MALVQSNETLLSEGSSTLTFTQSAIRVESLKEFIDAIPDNAMVGITIQRGDPQDPREAGTQTTKIRAAWSQQVSQRVAR